VKLDAYDDMMGLEFGQVLPSMEMAKEGLVAAAAGGGAILLTSAGIKAASDKLELESRVENPLVRSLLTSGTMFLIGLTGGRMLYDTNREAAMGVVGGLGGMAAANLIDAVFSQVTGNERMMPALGESGYGGDYGSGDGMEALAALETPGVTSAPGAFSGFADPTVTPETLMGGLDGTVVQEETLGGLQAYAPYLA
jgi:hypothetical protein